MVLRQVDGNGWKWIRGADRRDTPLPLGPKENTGQFGRHYIGLNNPYRNPFFIRAYFDPSDLDLSRYEYLGYVQILEAKILKTSVKPGCFGGALGKRPVVFSNSVVDFMGPGDARARQPAFSNMPIPPMYPFNAMLTTSLNQLSDFAKTTAPLGFIYYPTLASGNDDQTISLAPSLTAQVDLSLLTEEDLEKFPAAMEISVPMTREELASKPLVTHLIEIIQGGPDNKLTEWDKKINRDSLRFPRFVGRYLVINVKNTELMDPILCVWVGDFESQQNRVPVKIKLIDYDAVQTLEEEATYALFERAAEYLRSIGNHHIPMIRSSSAKGLGKPMPLPIKDGDFCAAISVSDVVYGQPIRQTRNSRLEAISGINYDVNLVFDESTRTLIPNGITNAREMVVESSSAMYAINSYFLLLESSLNDTVNLSNFDLVGSPLFEPIPTPPA